MPITQIDNVLYTAKAHITGGRDGSARTSDGRLDVKLSPPGSHGTGTNPEQLLAVGWSACFLSAIHYVAGQMKVRVPDASVDTEIDLGTGQSGYLIQARLTVNLPGITSDIGHQLVEAAHKQCPYSKATHGNINVTTKIVAGT